MIWDPVAQPDKALDMEVCTCCYVFVSGLVLSRYHNFELNTGTRKKISVLDTNSIPQ